MYKKINELLETRYTSDREIDWASVSRDYVLSESFIEEFSDNINWLYISIFQKLSDELIRKFKDKVHWYEVSAFQVLSESIIEEFKDKVNWECISRYQLLRGEFIIKNSNNINWIEALKHQPFLCISEELSSYFTDYSIIDNKSMYYLYQQTKNRGWFIGYIDEDDYLYFKKWSYLRFSIRNGLKNYPELKLFKVRIYWRDLIFTNKSSNFEFIREVKGV